MILGLIGNRTRLLSLAAASLFAVTVDASAASAPAAAPTVETIVADYVAARGGLAKIQAIETLRQTGRAFAGQGREALVVRELKRPGRIRFEFTVQGVTAVFVCDGKNGWKVSPFEDDMQLTELPDEVTQDAMEQADLEGPLVNWKGKGHQVELVGRETIDGREAYKLKLTLKSGGVRYEYIDVATHYELRADSTRKVRGQDVEIQTTFSDQKKTGGVLFPRKLEVAAAGRAQRLRVVVDKVEVNPPLSDARFEKPASAQR